MQPMASPEPEDPIALSPPLETVASPQQVEPVISLVSVNPVDELPGRKIEKTFLPQGKTLRLLALDLFGNREFWVYIYLENKDKISNPNRVPSGIELLLPDKSAYSIDAEDSQSVAKAKSLGNEVLKNF